MKISIHLNLILFALQAMCIAAALAQESTAPNQLGQKQPLKLFILCGQSNCEGNGDGDKLQPELTTPDQYLMIWSENEKAWKPLVPSPSNPSLAKMYGLGATQFGPEISFGHAMRKVYPNHRIGIVKVAVGGTSVLLWSKDFGSPEWKALMDAEKIKYNEGQSFYARLLLPQVTHAIEAARAEGSVEVAALVHVQTEADSDRLKWAREWAPRVVKLHQDLAADAGYSPGIPLVVMRPHIQIYVKEAAEVCVIHKSERCFSPYGQAILGGLRTAAEEGGAVTTERLRGLAGLTKLTDKEFESELGKMHLYRPPPACYTQMEDFGIMNRGLDGQVAEHPNVVAVRSDDLPTIEGLHFNTEGILELGRRLAAAYRVKTGGGKEK